MKVIEQSHIIEKIMPENPIEFIASCARTCYKSEPKANPENDKKLVRMLFEKGHHSQLEHASASVRLITDRSMTHEIARHRIGVSLSQESQRYCKYGNMVLFIKPHWASDNLLGEWDNSPHPNVLDPLTNEEFEWLSHCKGCASKYRTLLNTLPPQDARSVLPNSTKTEIVVTANLREWIHIFNLRTSKQAHPQIRQLMQSVKEDFQQYIPILFD